MSAGYISVVSGIMVTDIANNMSVPLETTLFCLNLELITSQNGVDYSISYKMVNNIKKNKKTIKKNTKQKKRFFNNTSPGCCN